MDVYPRGSHRLLESIPDTFYRQKAIQLPGSYLVNLNASWTSRWMAAGASAKNTDVLSERQAPADSREDYRS